MKFYLTSLIQAIKTTFEDFSIHIRISFRCIPFRILVADFLSISLSIGFVIIPSLVFGLCLLIVPQGRDAFLLVIEKMISGQFQQFVCLLLSICCWAYASELGVRYAIAISDNSGLNLSEQRVRWRKAVQRMLAAFFLVFPFIVVLTELIRLMFLATFIPIVERGIYLGSSVFIVGLLFSFVIYLYFSKFGQYGPNQPQRTILGKRSLPPLEQSWLNKLYGIYNDFTFTFPKASGFKSSPKESYKDFLNQLVDSSSAGLENLPQDKKIFTKGRLVPEQFELINSGYVETQTSYLYKWVYHIPSSFYNGFHKQVKQLLWISVVVIFFVAFLPADCFFFRAFGAPGLICLAFACYTGLYIGLLYLDKSVFRSWRFFSLRFFLLLLLLVVSYVNSDHPARVSKQQVTNRVTAKENFRAWFTAYKTKYKMQGKPLKSKYPVIFVCAEGGAFRTGAYTGIFLSSFEKALAESKESVDLRNSLYGMSGVSGGAVGLGYYNAIAFRDKLPIGDNTVEKAKKFFTNDSLSPLIGKMLFGEFVNLFIPYPMEIFDRAIALERTWEYAYENIFESKKNVYKSKFIDSSTNISPTLIINTTEVETGLQCIISNHQISTLRFGLNRDLFDQKLNNLPYSTALNFSSRFPLFSPAAAVKNANETLHFVDGGYVENTGSSSMLELLKDINADRTLSKEVAPVVITLLFAPDESTDKTEVKWLNELSEVILATYNTRAGRTKTARQELKEFVKNLDGISIDAPFRSKEVPMNWVLSERSIAEVSTNVKNILHPNEDVMQLLTSKGYTFLKFKK
ncbi:patatin-like phospholipase family protein [Nubsella zeaxanthinifaciens]|uniref:patatin-like phospholipase family protein n=1 Tax=Nubsella zeaxanthinifaciens TaxID=392412 RepID=UPI000DE2EC01|nr:patatin-like phospholipase family protein [Nubsella zeaxanthinifaciens]